MIALVEVLITPGALAEDVSTAGLLGLLAAWAAQLCRPSFVLYWMLPEQIWAAY
jgi:hypothetical protein